MHFKGSIVVESPYHERHFEFDRIMKKNNIETLTYELEWNRFDSEYYRQVIHEISVKGMDFDGVFAVDRMAIECMNEAKRNHRKVPRDVKIVAYDGTFITELVEPQMTAVVQPIEKLAEESVRLLNDLIKGVKYKNKQIMLEVTLRKGNTTIT